MFRPTGDLIFVTKEKKDQLVTPIDGNPKAGDIFKVVDIGNGEYTETGNLIKPQVQKGDRVCVAGKLLKVPETNDVWVARASDVICFERNSNE